MAKRKINKSLVIREYAAANPEAGPSAIVKGLAEQGLKVSVALVSQALKNSSSEPKKRGRPAKGTAKAKPNAASSKVAANFSSVDHLLLAAEFSHKIGGIDAALDALNAVKKIAAKMS
jgi:hypothetical protein